MNIPDKFWNAAAGALGLLTIFLIVISVKEFKTISYVGSNPNGNTITVSGSGEITARPDIATFSFGVSENAKTVSEAQAAATAKINAALKVLKEAGIPDNDIRTESYGINPHYEYQSSVCVPTNCPPSRSILTGYDVSQNISVKVRDLTKVGDLFTAIGSLGLQNINQLAFSVDDSEKLETEARDEAINEAKSKAEILADQLGVDLVRVVNFSEFNDSPLPLAYGMGGADSVSVSKISPRIPAGEYKITRNVSITYEIR